MLKNVYEGLNAEPKVYLTKEYFCEMYPTCVSSKLCEFILFQASSSFSVWGVVAAMVFSWELGRDSISYFF